MKKIIFFVVIGMIALSACNNNKLLEQRHEFKNYTWNRFDSLMFETKITDAQQKYNIYLTLRYITQYPYDNLKVNFTVFSPTGDTRTTLHTFKIKDSEGKLQGDGAGDLYDLKLQVKKDICFNQTGVCKFQLDNLMDHYDIPGLVDIGIIVEKAK